MISPVSVDGPPKPLLGIEGQVFGKYRVIRKLGEGGMGSVYECVHSEIGQRVALKVLHQNVASAPSYSRRFLDEARAVGAVGHPGLVKVHDFDHTPDGTAYIVMEFLAGESLSSRLASLRNRGELLSTGQVLRLIRQIASALKAVHEKNIVHRDLKPENIVLVPDPDTHGGERPKILDFGLAKLTDGSNTHKTTAGTALGTPLYMSPEQCEGRSDVTDRADTYALGIMLYEMLAGQPPFRAESAAALLRQHIVREPPPLPESVPPAVAALVRQMLAKTPEERPTMAELLRRIEASATEVVQPIKEQPSLRIRRSTLYIMSAAAVLAVVGVVAAVLLILQHTRRPLPVNNSGTMGKPVTKVEAPARTEPPAVKPDQNVVAPATNPGPGSKPAGDKQPPRKKAGGRDKDPLRIEALPDKRRGT